MLVLEEADMLSVNVRIPATPYLVALFTLIYRILFHPHTVNILNVSYYLTIERDLVQVGLRSKDQFLYISEQAHFP